MSALVCSGWQEIRTGMRNESTASASLLLAFKGVELRGQLTNGPNTVPFAILAQAYQTAKDGGAPFCGLRLPSHTPAARGNAKQLATYSAPLWQPLRKKPTKWWRKLWQRPFFFF